MISKNIDLQIAMELGVHGLRCPISQVMEGENVETLRAMIHMAISRKNSKGNMNLKNVLF